ncbi:MAG: glycerol-3-phosphate dehydrogenase subunit GlpB [Caldilineaceae bacterium]
MFDLLVIGAGLTGLTAALTAAQAGLKVGIIAKGMGATHWHAGTIDLLGYLPGADQPVSAPFEALASLPADHPYHRLGADTIRQSLASFQQMLNEVGLTYANATTAGQNLSLPSPVGAVRPVYAAPTAQLGGTLGQKDPLLLVGFRGLRDFYPKLIAENLCKQGYQARAELVPLDLIWSRRDINLVHLAEALDQSANRHHLGAALKKLVHPSERIGLPAILGLDQHQLTLSELQTQTGATVFEIPTLPPSVPGIRLYRALRTQLQKQGVRIEANMEVSSFGAQEGRIQWVETATSSRPLRHYASNFLLATGGILGGGFNSDAAGNVWEVVFRLPLTAPQDRRQWFQSKFLDARGHPIFHGGVEVNKQWQPIDGAGNLIYRNLWAAGGLLAHADPIRERSLEGLAITTGMVAAGSVVKVVKGLDKA